MNAAAEGFQAKKIAEKPFRPGLPDGIFSNQKHQIWVNFGEP
jgi:sugar lactone lactonase YvrE